MARFRYSMQSILDIKMKMETQKKQAFSAARAVLDQEEERLEGLSVRKRGYEEEAVGLLCGDLNLRDIVENQTAILRMDGFIADQRVRVSAAERNLEHARVEMTEAMKERKTHENLREKAFEQFLAEENRREGKEVDELTSYVYGQRRRAGGKAGGQGEHIGITLMSVLPAPGGDSSPPAHNQPPAAVPPVKCWSGRTG